MTPAREAVLAFYNENDRYPAAWLRNLIDAGHIAPGTVDERSIADLQPEDVRGYTQAHFFAGIGVWSHALRLAGWDDRVPVWTGSCPCQPFSAAGKRKGHADERHLWPEWFRLIRECRPPYIFGEQVASKDGLAWLDTVHADLEGAGYAVGAVDTCAASVGAPHIRQRLYFVAYDTCGGTLPTQLARRGDVGERNGHAGELADAERGSAGRRRLDVGAAQGGAQGKAQERERVRDDARDGEHAGVVGDTDHQGPQGRRRLVGEHGSEGRTGQERHGATSGFWSDARWVWCRDGKWRPHGPESFPLTMAHGATARVGRLRAYGNAIVAPLAAEFIAAFMETQASESTDRGGSRKGWR